MQTQTASVKSAFAVGQRVGGGPHLAQISISPDMNFPDQLQIIIKHLIKAAALLPCLCKNHWKMQADHADIKTAHKHRLILIIGRGHAAPLKPGG